LSAPKATQQLLRLRGYEPGSVVCSLQLLLVIADS
jgi:hypothetical protein